MAEKAPLAVRAVFDGMDIHSNELPEHKGHITLFEAVIGSSRTVYRKTIPKSHRRYRRPELLG